MMHQQPARTMLQTYRDARISASMLAHILGVSRSHIYQYINKNAPIPTDALNRLTSWHNIVHTYPAGALKYMERMQQRVGPNGNTLHTMLKEKEWDQSAIHKHIKWLKPSILASYTRDQQRPPRPLTPAGHLTIECIAVESV